MSFGLRNWKKQTPLRIKLVGDMCVYSLPLWQALVMSSPFSETVKLWINFIFGAFLILAKMVTKLFSIESHEINGELDRQCN